MGLFDKLRGELIDIIEWVDDDRHTLVWRFPRYNNEIKNGAQLIVRPGQMAIFVRQGQVADVFSPGQYQLSTKNLPVLSTLGGWLHGFESPFKAEVYFVSTRQVTDLRWGTPNPVMLRDPDFGPIRLRAFGTYALRATDPAALLRELVGTDSSFDTEEITELLRSLIVTEFSNILATSELAALDLAANYPALSEKLRRTVVERVDDEYGLDLPALFVVNISFPEEVERALDQRTSMGVLGDLGRFQQYQMGNAMMAAAANPSGGEAGAGIGMGMGLAMANQMAQNVGTNFAPPPVPGAQRRWYLAEKGQSVGPLSATEVEHAIASGRLTAQTPVWCAGMAQWKPAAETELAQFLAPPPPPPA